MKQQLLELYHSNPHSFTQKLKSKKHAELLSWFLLETAHINETSLKAKAYILLFEPELACAHGNTKKWTQGKIRYCGTIEKCQCHREHLNAAIATFAKNRTTVEKEISHNKRKDTWIEKYGVDNPLKLKQNIEKQKAAVLAVDRNKINKEKLEQGFEQVVARIAEHVKPCFTKEEYGGCFRKNKYLWECITCSTKFLAHVDNGYVPRCDTCNPPSSSKFENEIAAFVEEQGFSITKRTKTIIPPKELDIYIEEKMLAIECNGIYWHSTAQCNDKYYHVDKFLRCEEQGIQLVQIFEDEWISKQDIVKSRLLSILGKAPKLYARSTVCKKIENRLAKTFVEHTHLRGWATASMSYGLYSEDALVAVMTFGKSRYNTSQWELIRYCSIGQVIGGAGKLLAHFIHNNNPAQICTYADRCWSNGKLYRTLGFKDVTHNKRNTGYWYIDRHKRIHRSVLTHKRLVKMGFDSNLTEEEIVTTQLKYHKIYDAGNLKFLLDLPTCALYNTAQT